MFRKNILTSNGNSSTKEGNNRFLAAEGNNRFLAVEGKVVFNLVFQDDDNCLANCLITHRGFFSTIKVKCLVSNIVFPMDEEKLNGMAC